MVVLLNQFVLYFLECFIIRVKYMLQFLRRDDLQNTGFDPAIENCRILFFEAVGSKAEGNIS